MKKFLMFLVPLTFLVSAIAVYVHVKTEFEKPIPNPIFIEAGKEVTFIHPEWNDGIVFEENNRLHRKKKNDWATATGFKDDILTISWDHWGVEKYKRTAPNTFEFYTE